MSAASEEQYNSITTHAAGRDWVLLRPQDLESLWDNMTNDEFAEDERLPYWVELWPSSLALSNWLFECRQDIAGKFCLDLGCGLGLSTLVAHSLGAKVVGMDYEKAALHFASLNAVKNGLSGQPLWLVADWRKPAFRRGAFSFIWGGDIMYERRFVTPVLDCLEYALTPGGKVWLAEPNRNVYDDFRAALVQRGWSSRRLLGTKVEPLHVQKHKVTVNLWELTLP